METRPRIYPQASWVKRGTQGSCLLHPWHSQVSSSPSAVVKTEYTSLHQAQLSLAGPVEKSVTEQSLRPVYPCPAAVTPSNVRQVLLPLKPHCSLLLPMKSSQPGVLGYALEQVLLLDFSFSTDTSTEIDTVSLSYPQVLQTQVQPTVGGKYSKEKLCLY